MKNTRTFKIGLLLSSFLISPFAYSAVDTVDMASDKAVQSGAFFIDRLTGDVYAGLAASAGDYAITKLSDSGSGITKTAVGGTTNASDNAIRLMTPSYNGTTLRLVYCDGTTNRTKISIQSADGTTEQVSGAVKDGDGNATPNDGILAITAADSAIFAAVSDGTADWSAGNPGIAVLAINNTTLALAGTPTNATDIPLAANTKGASHGIVNAAVLQDSTPALYWDPVLEKLYYGAAVETSAADGDAVVSVLVAKSDQTDGDITFLETVTAQAAFDDVVNGVLHVTDSDASDAAVAKVYNLGVMHTSTGFAYLILNGGTGDTDADFRNRVYAQPLVTGNTNSDINGTFAAKSLTTTDFSTQASAANDLCKTTDEQAKVGVVALPFTADTVTKMQIVGDTVYVSGEITNADDDEGGIYHSTAEFNENGKIIRWTRWTKTAPNIIGVSTTDGEVQNFAINPRNGKVWGVKGSAPKTVNLTTWGTETAATELAGAVNAVLTDGCTAIGVFDRTTVNFGDTTISRFALFGGNNKVVLTIPTRTSGTPDDPGDTFSIDETAVTDFSDDANFKSTTLPAGAGYVTAIGGTNYTQTREAFFFLAGTSQGLYALALADGGGGSLDFSDSHEHLGYLDATTSGGNSGFFDGDQAVSWQAVSNVTGHIKAIKTSNAATFILARDTGIDGTIIDKIYMFNNDDVTVSALSTNVVTIAQSGTSAAGSDLSDAHYIYDFAIINGVAAGTDSQIIISTNNGHYQSKTAGGIEGATSHTTALWTPIGQKTGNTGNEGVMYHKIHTHPTTNLNTSFRAIYIADDANQRGTQAHTGIDQFCCSDDDNLATGNKIRRFPNDDHRFNSDSFTSFLRQNRIFDYWTDGGRRAFIATPTDGSGTTGLYWLPFNVSSSDWNVTDPLTKVSATALANKRLHCIAQLPDGHICVGHESGIAVM